MVTSRTRLIAGVSVPDSPLITEVIEYAQKLSEDYLFNHAMRSWLFAAKIKHIKSIDCDQEVVAVGTILHDIGLTAGVSGSNRFEVNGANAALSIIPQTARSPMCSRRSNTTAQWRPAAWPKGRTSPRLSCRSSCAT